jgi:hypothetical protein
VALAPSQAQLAARVYAQQAQVLRRALEGAVDDAYDDIDWDEDDEDEDGEDLAEAFADRVAPLARAGQRALVSTLSGYLRVVVPGPLGRVEMDDVIEDDRDAWRAPVFRTWGALGAGVAFAAAVALGRELASRKADTEMAIAQTRAMGALTEGTVVRGYRRVLEGDGCEFCAALADVEVASGDAMELHPGCNCSVEPVF